MRWIGACLAFVAVSLARPTDTFDLRQRYGDPRTERFLMRPDVTLTASYGTDGKACHFEIEPRKDLLQDMVANETLSKDTVDQLLEEIAPRSAWGKERLPLGSNVTSGSCNSGITVGDYENVGASILYGFCNKTIEVHRATVTYKRSACAQFWKPPRDKTQTTPQSKGTP